MITRQNKRWREEEKKEQRWHERDGSKSEHRAPSTPIKSTGCWESVTEAEEKRHLNNQSDDNNVIITENATAAETWMVDTHWTKGDRSWNESVPQEREGRKIIFSSEMNPRWIRVLDAGKYSPSRCHSSSLQAASVFEVEDISGKAMTYIALQII